MAAKKTSKRKATGSSSASDTTPEKPAPKKRKARKPRSPEPGAQVTFVPNPHDEPRLATVTALGRNGCLYLEGEKHAVAREGSDLVPASGRCWRSG